jgi:hypothetical protein
MIGSKACYQYCICQLLFYRELVLYHIIKVSMYNKINIEIVYFSGWPRWIQMDFYKIQIYCLENSDYHFKLYVPSN